MRSLLWPGSGVGLGVGSGVGASMMGWEVAAGEGASEAPSETSGMEDAVAICNSSKLHTNCPREAMWVNHSAVAYENIAQRCCEFLGPGEGCQEYQNIFEGAN